MKAAVHSPAGVSQGWREGFGRIRQADDGEELKVPTERVVSGGGEREVWYLWGRDEHWILGDEQATRSALAVEQYGTYYLKFSTKLTGHDD